jgi:hypothetical protein
LVWTTSSWRTTLHGVVDDFTIAADRVNAVAERDRVDTDVCVARAAASIEGHFGFAGAAARFEGREVQETQVDGLLDLEDLAIGEDDVGDMRLNEVDFADGSGICRSAEESSNVRRQGIVRHARCPRASMQ